jgi:uncharacterized protein (DUF58 family)
MRYQGPTAAMSKFQYSQCLAAALAYLILQQRDSVGMATFDEEVRELVWARSNPAHLKHLLQVMEAAVPRGRTDTGLIFHDLAERIKKRGVVVVISDLMDDAGGLLSGLKHFRHRGHETIVFHMLDRAELEFPFEHVTLFRSLERRPDVLAEPRMLRAAYLSQMRQFIQEVRAGCRAQGIDYVQVPTDGPWDLALSGYLASRMSRPK